MYKIYQIEAGDTMDSVASKFGTTSDDLRRLNGVMGTTLNPGSYLIVPLGIDSSFYSEEDSYTVKKGDNMYQIAKKFQVDYPFLLAYNGKEEKDYIYPGEVIRIPREKDRVYFSTQGDTVTSVAENFGITPQALLQNNPDLFLKEQQIIHY